MVSTNYLTSSVILFLICMLMEMTGCDQVLSSNDGTDSDSNGLDDLTEHPRKARFLNQHVHHVYPHHPLGSLHHGYGYGGYHGGLHHGGYGGYHGYHGYHGLHARQAEGNANNNNNNINCNKGISQGQPWGVLLSGSIPLNPNQQFSPIAGFQTTRIDYNSLPTTTGYQGMGVNVVGNQIQTNPMGMHPVPVINIPAPISIPGFYNNGDSNLKSHWSILTSAANRPSFSNVYGTNSIQPTLMKYGPGIVIGTKDTIGTNNVYGLNNALVPGTYKDVSIITNEISPHMQYTGNDLNGKYNGYYGYQRHREESANSSISQGRATMQDMLGSYIANKEDIGLSSKSQSDMYSNFNKTGIDENNPSKNTNETSDMHTNNKIQNSSNKQNSSNSIHNQKLKPKDEVRNTNNVGTDISAINENVEKKETNSSEDIIIQPDSIAMNEMMYRNTPPLPILGYYGSNLGDSLYLQNSYDLARTPYREPDGGLHIDLLNAGTTFLGSGNGIPVYQLSYRGEKHGMNDQKMQVGRLLNQDGNIMPNQANIGIGFQDQNSNQLKLWPANNIQNYDQNGAQFGYVSIPMDQSHQPYFQGYARILRSLAETSKNDKQDSTENSTETV